MERSFDLGQMKSLVHKEFRESMFHALMTRRGQHLSHRVGEALDRRTQFLRPQDASDELLLINTVCKRSNRTAILSRRSISQSALTTPRGIDSPVGASTLQALHPEAEPSLG
jgi:hypothetical protein